MPKFLILLLVLSLISCGNDSEDTTNPENSDVSEDIEPDSDRPTCETNCQSVGQQICTSDTSFATCLAPENDFCFELVAEASCEENTICLDGECSDPPCSNTCGQEGASICTETNNGFLVCADHNEDGCLTFGEPILCSVGERCSGGTCPVECDTSDCENIGERICMENGIAECGNHNRDGCLTWEFVTNCSAGQNCSNGTCVEGGACLLISEYLEGDGQDKALELYNCSGGRFDLSNVGICLFAENTTSPPCTHTTMLTSAINTGQVFIICHPDADLSDCDYRDQVMSFNGDDRIVLFNDDNQDGEFNPRQDIILDAFGEYNYLPDDDPWEDANYRRCSDSRFDGQSRFYVENYFTRHPAHDLSHFGTPPTLNGCQ